MAIHYRKITNNTVEPSSPATGDIWIRPIDSTYQGYIWISGWKPFLSGGVFASETDADTNYLTVIIQEETPPSNIIQPGWIWIKESIEQAWIYIFDYMPFVGV